VTTTLRYRIVDSPVGPLTLAGLGSALMHLRMVDQTHEPDRSTWLTADDHAFPEAVDQLAAYFAGELTEFDLELELTGRHHRRRVEIGSGGHHHLHLAHPTCVFHFNGKHDLGPRASGTLVFRIDRLDELLQLGRPQALAGFRGLARRRLAPRCQGNPCRKDQGGGNCENTHGFGT